MLIKDDRFLTLGMFARMILTEEYSEEERQIILADEQKELALGVYQLYDSNMPDAVSADYNHFISWTIDDLRNGTFFSEYGVCDNYQQVLEKFPFLQTDENQYVVTVTVMKKCHQPPQGGWRWHKWGEYIGTKNPQHEYLYDEDESIQEVFCYHIYKRKA